MGGFVVQKYLESRDAPAAVLIASAPPRCQLSSLLRSMRARCAGTYGDQQSSRSPAVPLICTDLWRERVNSSWVPGTPTVWSTDRYAAPVRHGGRRPGQHAENQHPDACHGRR